MSEHEPGGTLDKLRLLMAQQFAQVYRNFTDCSDEVRAVAESMIEIINHPDADAEERQAALDTLADALFPFIAHDGLGINLATAKCLRPDGGDYSDVEDSMAVQEAGFATRLQAAMDARGINQVQLAEKAEVGQPAIAMILARDCRPQKRTVRKLAAALGVKPADLWPPAA
jgi:lambda repressor-like predicted transcriptional regulator